MGLNLTVNIISSAFLVSVFLFFLLIGILLYTAYQKIVEVLEFGDAKSNRFDKLENSAKNLKVSYILAFIGSGLCLILAILYAGHETVINPSEYFHLILFLLIYILLIATAIYAYIALGDINSVGVNETNGVRGYIWASLFLTIFVFLGLTASSTSRLGMNIVRGQVSSRIKTVENSINEHLPHIRNEVDTHLHQRLPELHQKVNELHANAFPQREIVASCDGNVRYSSVPAGSLVSSQVLTPSQMIVSQVPSPVIVQTPSQMVLQSEPPRVSMDGTSLSLPTSMNGVRTPSMVTNLY